jgi:hypothetical protein
MAKLDDKLAALATMSPAQLRGEWLQLFGYLAPGVGHRLLGLAIAHRLQEKAIGGLQTRIVREIDAMVRQLNKTGAIRTSTVVAFKPGTRLVREWRGTTHQVLLLDDGYLWQDEQYNSLSEIAYRITGTRWSGPRFFGLTRNTKVAA